MSDPLPDYERHPLDETVMGLQFEPLPFNVQHLFLYWSRIRDRYPRIEEQLSLPHTLEGRTFEPNRAPQVIITPQQTLPMSRFWLLDASETHLIQVQNDRFLRNWRLRNGNEEYPRYETLSHLFWQEWEGFKLFLRDERIHEPKIDQCELAYVNYIDLDEIGGLSGIQKAFSAFGQDKKAAWFLPSPEIMKWESAYALPQGRGRLHVSASPNFRQRDFKLVVNFTLTARGKPSDHPTDQQLLSWFTIAHEWIVRAFDELTTPEMHRIWKKKT